MSDDATAVTEAALKAFQNDDVKEVARLLAAHPKLRDRINERTGPFGTPAVTNVKSIEMLDVLLEAGADIDLKSDWWAGGFGLLHTASTEIAKAAIDRGATVDIHAAARLGMIDELRSALEKDPTLVNAPGGDGQSPLHFASCVEVAQILLDHGAEINALDVDHVSTPAQWMVDDRQDVARFLVEKGCRTDILMAAALGDLGLVQELVSDDKEVVRMRVSDEFFPMIGQDIGGTIYQWKLGWYVSSHQVARKFGHEDICGFLSDNCTPDERLLNACWLNEIEVVEALLQHNPRLSETVTPAGKRHIAHAARNDNLDAVLLMLKAGLPLTGRSQHGATALHWAAWNGNLDMTRALLSFGPSLDDRANDYEGTPLDWAIYASVHGWCPDKVHYGTIVEDLLKAGSPPPEKASGSEPVRKVLAQFGVRD